jgi:hypothetical protein
VVQTCYSADQEHELAEVVEMEVLKASGEASGGV